MNQPLKCELTAAQQVLLRLLAHAVFQADAIPEGDADWPAVLRESIQQTVFPQVYAAAADVLPDAIRGALEKRYFQALTKNLNIIDAHHRIHTLLSGAGIPYTVLKGCASGAYYPEPSLRMMGDVDVYVRRTDLERVRQLLLENGCTQEITDHPNHWVFRMNGVEVEVHWAVTGVPAADDGTIAAFLSDLIETSSVRRVCEQEVCLPDDFHHGLVILLHTVSHMTAGGVGLRHLLDWLVFQFSMTEEVFLHLFEEPLRQIRLWRFVQVLGAVGARFFSCPAWESCAGIPEELTLDLILDLFEGGNFGNKNPDRLNQSKLLRNNETRQVKGGSGFGHAFAFLNQRAKALMPAAERHPILLPIAWIRVLIRRNRDVKTGKQPKLRLKKTITGAKQRQNVYEQLRLFEE